MNYNFAFSDGSFVAYNDGQMLISLKGDHKPASFYQAQLRGVLHDRFPNAIFYFQPSDMITQILDFGTIAQIDIQVAGRHTEADYEAAKLVASKLEAVEGVVDAHVHQIMNVPEFFVDIDRRLASELHLTEQQAAQQMNISLSGSFQVSPNFWVDPKNGIPYQLWVQTPEWRNSSMNALKTTPIFTQTDGNDPGVTQMLASIATVKRRPIQTVINHVNTQPTFDVLANTQHMDLGTVSRKIDTIVAEVQKTLQPPDKIVVRGQIESMESAFSRLEFGLGIALVAVYLLMAVNFQSWGDPFVVLLALPIAFCGIVFSLFVTGTTFSIPSLFGSIMSVGVASANSILLVTFAKEHREATGCSALEAAIAAGETRLRPVLMTASAMFVGLIPMAIGAGEGGEHECRASPRGARRHSRRDLLDLGSRALLLLAAASRRGQTVGGLHVSGTQSMEETAPRKAVSPPRKLPFVIAFLLLGGLLAFGIYHHWQEHDAAVAVQKKAVDFVPTVRTFTSQRVVKPIEIIMPGETRPFDSAKIYARATGYISERLVDFGTRVRKGDLMLKISAPQTDAQYDQAEAQLGQLEAQLLQSRAEVDKAKANLTLAKVTSSRISPLAGQGYATQQNADNNSTSVQGAQASLESAAAGVKVIEANIKAQQATVEGLKASVGFERVIAPFDGVVSQRTVDIGDLVHADSGNAPLLVVDRDDVLRASVNIPQTPAMGVSDGLAADVRIPQMPGKVFKGKVDRSSVNLLYSSRTLLTQVDIPNADHKLRAGLFVDITLDIPRPEPIVAVPADALVFNSGGTQVAIVGKDDRVEMRPVEIERDLGTTLDLKKGLGGGETVILNPPAGLKTGSKIKVAPE